MAEPSIPDRFVHTWAQIEAMPDPGMDDSRRFVIDMLKRNAQRIVQNALYEALELTRTASSLMSDSSPKVDE